MPTETYDFAVCKNCARRAASLRYRLKVGRVWVCRECDLHYIDYLDPAVAYDGTVEYDALTRRRRNYLESRYKNNPERFHRHLQYVQRYRNLNGLRVLDVGCGSGYFLYLINDRGGRGVGADLWDPAVLYARETFGLTVHKYPVEHPIWLDTHKEGFDAVTLWDVIEHVNFPLETLRAAAALLVDGGLLFIDTPCRDAFFHRFGTATYCMSAGRFPTLLNVLYSKDPFGHKQIISTSGMEVMLHRSGFEIVYANKVCELSSPCESYISRCTRSRTLSRWLAPAAAAFISVTRVRNKMIVVGRKTSSPSDLSR